MKKQIVILNTTEIGLYSLIYKGFLAIIHRKNGHFRSLSYKLASVCKNALQATENMCKNMGAVSRRPSRKAVKTHTFGIICHKDASLETA